MSENEKTIQFLLMLVRRKQVEILEINERFKNLCEVWLSSGETETFRVILKDISESDLKLKLHVDKTVEAYEAMRYKKYRVWNLRSIIH